MIVHRQQLFYLQVQLGEKRIRFYNMDSEFSRYIQETPLPTPFTFRRERYGSYRILLDDEYYFRSTTRTRVMSINAEEQEFLAKISAAVLL